jgi:pimeloyl-ACP methyl ester carboxylesterase
MRMNVVEWEIEGSDGQPILGDCHLPDDQPRGVVLIAHGFKGYKDYGFLPRLADALAAASFIAHRFNFSHSGMTRKIERFEKPQLFERDTWGKQVADLLMVAAACHDGRLDGQGLEQVWFGHSRGGVTSILAAAQTFTDDESAPCCPAGLVTAAAPASACSLSNEDRARLRQRGSIESPSGRTGQILRVGKAWLDEMEASPKALDPVFRISQVMCPTLIVHGSDDPTVPADAAGLLASAAGNLRQKVILDGAQHTFDAPNPLPADAKLPDATQQLLGQVAAFCDEVFDEQAATGM